MARLGIKSKKVQTNPFGYPPKPKPQHDEVIDFKNIRGTIRFPLGTEQYDRLVRLDGVKRERYMFEMNARGISVEHDLKSNSWIVRQIGE